MEKKRWGKLKEKKICQRCGNEFRPWHKNQIFCSRFCLFAGGRKTSICHFCHQEFPLRQHENFRFCSQSCSAKDKALRNFPQFQRKRVSLLCRFCGKGYEIKKSRAKVSLYCSRSCHAKATWAIKLLPSLPLRKDQNKGIEKILQRGLEARGIEFETHKRIGRFFPDIVLEKEKIIIEADGIYWHTLPSSIERDDRKNKFFKDLGYKVFRFTDKEIWSDGQACVSKVLQTI